MLASGANVIKKFTNVRNKLECFVPGRLFLPSLMFVGEAISICKSGALKVLHKGVLWPYQEMLHWPGKNQQRTNTLAYYKHS